MKLKLIASVLVLMVALTGVLGATSAYFSDYETSIGNTFTAGKLDLQINGQDGNVSLFELRDLSPSDFDETSMIPDGEFDLGITPGHYPTNAYEIKNVGTITGYLNIKRVKVSNSENVLTDPEIKYGDTSDNVGELGAHLRTVIFIDVNKNYKYETGDIVLFGENTYSTGGPVVDGTAMDKLNEAAVQEKLSKINYKVEPGENVAIVGVVTRWYRSGNNNEAQSDSVTLDLVFTLDQTQTSANQVPLPANLKVAPNYGAIVS